MANFFIVSFLCISVQYCGTVISQKPACDVHCHTEEMQSGLIPRFYNSCTCLITLDDNFEDIDSFLIGMKCTPRYRSLKFRNSQTGAVEIHKAVVGVCDGNDLRYYINQSIFENEERDYIKQRNSQSQIMSSKSTSWIDGFRQSIMQLYRKPDGHLRFG